MKNEEKPEARILDPYGRPMPSVEEQKKAQWEAAQQAAAEALRARGSTVRKGVKAADKRKITKRKKKDEIGPGCSLIILVALFAMLAFCVSNISNSGDSSYTGTRQTYKPRRNTEYHDCVERLKCDEHYYDCLVQTSDDVQCRDVMAACITPCIGLHGTP